MVMYANEVERKEKYNNITWDKKLTTTYFSQPNNLLYTTICYYTSYREKFS